MKQASLLDAAGEVVKNRLLPKTLPA